jgi:hypothetical protein
VKRVLLVEGRNKPIPGKEKPQMKEFELKRLYRRIERASRLRTPWYLRLASLLGLL